jgi:preprotein translocase subunit SecF
MSGLLSRLYQGETKIDFIGRRRFWLSLSGAMLAACVALLVLNGLNYGIEFEGGISITAPIADDGPLAVADVPEIETAIGEALEPLDAGDAQIQVASGDEGRSVIVQSKAIADPEAQQEAVNVVAEAVGATVAETDSQRIGSKWGGEVTRKALNALGIFMLVVLAFISWRFEWKMAITAILAMFHDLLITAGVYSLVGFEVTPSTVIAILTILGYSLYDNVVVFDKVEENTERFAASGKMSYEDAVNLSLNEVFMRSLNTALSTLLPVAALLFVGAGLLGASTLKDLSLALFVGLLIGAYSSIFFATPILSYLKQREPKYKNFREKALRDARKTEGQPIPALVTSDGGSAPSAGTPASVTPAAGSSSTSGAAAAARARAGNKKAKRRKRR